MNEDTMQTTLGMIVGAHIYSERGLTPDEFRDAFEKAIGQTEEATNPKGYDFGYEITVLTKPNSERTIYSCETELLDPQQSQAACLQLIRIFTTIDPDTRIFVNLVAKTTDNEPVFDPIAIALTFNEAAFLQTHTGKFASDYDLSSDYVHCLLLEQAELDPELSLPGNQIDETLEWLFNDSPPGLGPVDDLTGYRLNDAIHDDEDLSIVQAFTAYTASSNLLYQDPEHIDNLHEFIAAASLRINQFMPSVNAKAEYHTYLNELTLETSYWSDDHEFAGTSTTHAPPAPTFATPTTNDDRHLFQIGSIPATSHKSIIGTIAIHHAELHALGLEFTHPSATWTKLVHDLAAMIFDHLAYTPKWKPHFKQSPSDSLQ